MDKKLFKNHIHSIHPYQPGKPVKEVERELGLRHVVKLASNENPLGPSRRALRAMRKALNEVHLYPEGTCHYLVQRLAQELKVNTNQLVIGNGSNEIIELLTRGFVSEGDQIISSRHSFLVYPILTQVCGGEFVEIPMKDYRYDLNGILEKITERTKIIFIANPNNPTGTYVTKTEVEDFLSKVPEHVLVCFDEAYVDFVDATDFPHMLEYLNEKHPHLVILRTFSKSYGLAGMRVGYGVGCPELIGYLHKIRQPFNVNLVAQEGALAALDDKFYLWRTKQLAINGRKFLYKQFKKMGLSYLESQSNFVLVDTRSDGEEVCKHLLKKGMIVRAMSAYGLSNWIRVTIGRRSQNSLFCRLLKECLSL